MSAITKPVALVGFMGAGKTTCGLRLATSLGVPFVDLDSEVEARSHGRIAQIFARDGEDSFRRREATVLRAVLREAGPFVLATGGGTFGTPRNRALLLQRTTTVFLQTPFAEALRRLRRSTSTRPKLQGSAAARRALFTQRQAFYARAHVCVSTFGRTPSQVVAQLLSLLPR